MNADIMSAYAFINGRDTRCVIFGLGHIGIMSRLSALGHERK